MPESDETKVRSGVQEAQRAFSEAGLLLPPIPQRFASELRTTTTWCFSTRTIDPMAMYMFDRYLWEALTGRAPDYLAFSHAGHGINSYALNYHLIDGPLVLIVQAPYGGAYMGDAEIEGGSAQFQRCGALIEAVESATARGLSAQSGRLYVFESGLRSLFAWGWLDQPLADEEGAGSWVSQRSGRGADPGVRPLPDHELPTIVAREWLDGQSFAERPWYPDRKEHEL